MAFNFQRNSPVLNFRPRAHVKPGYRQNILWPVLRYQVVAPEVRERPVNILQKAVLGMCRVGISDYNKVGERLHIHPGLAEKILHELKLKDFIDYHGIPTLRGLQALDDDIIENHRQVVGYVFQDPWNGLLWPRFIESSKLDFVELRYGETGYPELVFGNKGNPKFWKTYMHFPKNNGTPVTPSAIEIVNATKRHHRSLRFQDTYATWDEDDDGAALSDVVLERVSMVEEVPVSCFLHTYLYLPENEKEGSDWHVCDPFGFGMSIPLRKQIEDQADAYPGINTALERLIGGKNQSRVDDHRAWVKEILQITQISVKRRLTVNVQELSFYDKLLEMEFCHQEVIILGESCPVQKLRDMLNTSRRLMEGIFKEVFKYNNTYVWKDLSDGKPIKGIDQWFERNYIKAILNSSASMIGLNSPMPEELSSIPPIRIKEAAKYSQFWRVRPQIIVTLLSAKRDIKHPLRKAAKLNPNLLVDLYDITFAGDEASHSNKTEIFYYNRKEAIEVVEKIYQFISAIFELPNEN